MMRILRHGGFYIFWSVLACRHSVKEVSLEDSGDESEVINDTSSEESPPYDTGILDSAEDSSEEQDSGEDYLDSSEPQDSAGNTGDEESDIDVCTPSYTDPYDVELLSINEDELQVMVSYGGGCETHEWELCWDGALMTSSPPQVELSLGHNANNDGCFAIISEFLQFDVSTLQNSISSGNSITIHFAGQQVEYSF
jgi:hypothetical protein